MLLPYGGKQKIEEIHETLGGGAHNTSVAFARLGLKSAYCGLIGDDLWGKKILANLEAEGVSSELLSITENEKTSFSVILNSFEGERTVLNYLGANHLFTEEYFPLAKIMQSRWIFLNHLSGEANRLVKKVKLILENKNNIKLAWNPGGVQLKNGAKKFTEILKKTSVLFLNKEEAEQFSSLTCNKKLDNIRNAYNVNSIFQYFHKLGVKNVVITDGRNGAQASNGKERLYCPALKEKRKDTLGAGDSFASGFTGALMLNNNLQTALKFGTINATSVVNHYGAQQGLLKIDKIQKALEIKKIKITKIN
jgi:ribokinase